MNVGLLIAGWGTEDSHWEDSFVHLGLVLAVLLLIQLGLVTWSWIQVRLARRRMPLVVGGWGTRGKSGTERCKAAMFHAWGANVFSKTTGCEAMFIHATPQQPADEIFLFRPFEKATIYEQVNVLLAARKLGAEVFLYECMALNPRYVEVMQDGWMRDDFGTLTNAYPDHEDIQGPAGRNVAEVIGTFAPRGVRTWTCELQMLPILQDIARQRKSDLVHVPWVEAALITDDVLARLPYKEHPANLALVARLGRELGLTEEFIFKEIADHLVPDLGVLRTYPRIYSRGRSAIFSNGMSANERLGALGNWRRLGFGEHTPRNRPGEWFVIVINNRADRIPRSKVFAAVMAEDVNPHRFIVIGTNVNGMAGYVEAALAASAETIVISDRKGPAAVQDWLGRFCDRLKIIGRHPRDLALAARRVLLGCGQSEEAAAAILAGETWQQAIAAAEECAGTAAEREPAAVDGPWQPVRARLIEALRPGWIDHATTRHARDLASIEEAADAIGIFWREYRQVCSLQRQLLAGMRGEAPAADADAIVRTFRHRHIAAKIDYVLDATATGDQIVDRCIHAAPPGYAIHVLGMQNIKGTGLDFAYRWVYMLKVTDLTFALRSPLRQTRYAKLQQLVSYGDYHYFDARIALDACFQAQQDGLWRTEADQQLLARAIQVLQERVATCAGGLKARTVEGRWYDKMAGWLEPVLDVFDSIKRRVSYQTTLGDYVKGRLSRSRTQSVMQELMKRQKGNWLKAYLDRHAEDENDAGAGTAGIAVETGKQPYDVAAFAPVEKVAKSDAETLSALPIGDVGAERWRPTS